MTLKTRDLVATILVAAVAVPYIGYLTNGAMPFIKDPRGMAGAGLILGTIAFFVAWNGDSRAQRGRGEIGIAAVSWTLGILAVVFAETGAAELILAIFVVSIAVVWAVELVDAGVVHGHHPTGTAT